MNEEGGGAQWESWRTNKVVKKGLKRRGPVVVVIRQVSEAEKKLMEMPAPRPLLKLNEFFLLPSTLPLNLHSNVSLLYLFEALSLCQFFVRNPHFEGLNFMNKPKGWIDDAPYFLVSSSLLRFHA